MPSIEVLGSGRIDERDSAFPQAVQLPNGDVLCSFSVGGGPAVTGGTDWARSTDGGESWKVEGTVLAPTTDPVTSASLKLSLSPDGRTLYAYGARSTKPADGAERRDPVLCRSTDDGRTWSAPLVVPKPAEVNVGISHGVLPLASGRLLAPVILHGEGRPGERVVVALSDDDGETWPEHSPVFDDLKREYGYLEIKLAEIDAHRVIAATWTTTLDGGTDFADSFSISRDQGATWAAPKSTGIMGQTMTPVPLGGNRLLAVYNRRYGVPAIVAALVTFTDNAWTVHQEIEIFSPTSGRPTLQQGSGEDEWAQFEFGFPTAIRLNDGNILATHWSKEAGKFGVRWTKLKVGF